MAASASLSVGDLKYRIFLAGGALVIVLELALKCGLSQGEIAWDMRAENLLLPLPVAWAAEWYARRKANIHLRWFGSGARHVPVFIWRILLWALCTWILALYVFESSTPIRFVVNALAIYMWAGAFLETCNLIKVRAPTPEGSS